MEALTIWWTRLAGPFGSGIVISLKVFFLTLLMAIPLGLFVSLGKMSRFKIIRIPVHIYITILRGTPLLLQMLFVYFAPYSLFGIRSAYSRFVAVIIAFVLNYSAYFAEIYRGGIQSMSRGQYEAGAVLGFSRAQVFFRIILPQVVKRILPPVSNEVITLLKDTALVQILGVADLMREANNITTATFSIVPLAAAGVIYFGMNFVVERVFHFTEKRLDYYR